METFIYLRGQGQIKGVDAASGKKCIWEEGTGNGHRVPTFCHHNALLDFQGAGRGTHILKTVKCCSIWTG
jgi:hypothetical protein